MNSEIQSKLTELNEQLQFLDEERNTIWNLRFKDFEDLACAIVHYTERVEDAECLWRTIRDSVEAIYMKEGMEEGDAYDKANEYLSEQEAQLDYHIEESNYFKQRRC